MAASRRDWERAGRMLAERRVQIAARYANRRLFADEVGLNWRTLYDAEYGKRATFKEDTVRSFETAYRLVPGSLARTLAGGPLEPAVSPPEPARLHAAPPAPGAAGYPEPSAAARTLFPEDLAKQLAYDLPVDEDTKLEIFEVLNRKRRESAAALSDSSEDTA